MHQLKKKDVYRKIHVYLSSVVQVSNINFFKKINNDDDDNDGDDEEIGLIYNDIYQKNNK